MDSSTFPFRDTSLPSATRATDLLSRLTIEEKIAQMVYKNPAIERLGIPEYNWWNECSHGVARAGIATVFPHAIAMAATFDADLIHRVATVIGDEARAKHHAAARRGNRGIYRGLTYWTPNINIFRDPRWGRGQETFGECPVLTGTIASAFIRALQGDHPRYLKIVATPKHFAVHSGPEAKRHSFDAQANARDLYETYLPAFRQTIVEAGAYSVMTAYNRLNGEACSASPTLLEEILRGHWQFQGYVVSDCGAIEDMYQHHDVAGTPAEAAAMALRHGCDLCCGRVYTSLIGALEQGLITEAEIDTSLHRLLLARILLGMFDPEEDVPWSSLPFEIVDSPDHRALAVETACASTVLLKNDAATLPLSRDIQRIAVIGPNADDRRILLGNYNGIPSTTVTPLDGIRAAVSDATRVDYQPGCERTGRVHPDLETPDKDFAEAILAAENADAVVLVLGLSPEIEGEEGDAMNSDAAGDRNHIELPDIQQNLFDAVYTSGKPVIVILISGSALAIPSIHDRAAAVIHQFYGGQAAGTAIAHVLFGRHNPSGRLPVTVYRSTDQLPGFEDYRMEGRTYRFFDGEPLYPFGFGLSYTRFVYTDIEAPSRAAIGDPVRVFATVANQGDRAGDEAVQLYLSRRDSSSRVPIRQLAAFRRIKLAPGQHTRVEFEIPERLLAVVNDAGEHILEPGEWTVSIGGSQPDPVSRRLGAAPCVEARIQLTGQPKRLPR